MRVKPAAWILNVLLVCMAWSAGAMSNWVNDPAGSSGCVDNTWMATSLDSAPSARYWHTAVWTGREMIVWGGGYRYYDPISMDYITVFLNTGGRYDPATDTWRTISTVGAPGDVR